MQKVPISPAQSAGLSVEQMQRALAFEVEPFSGIPVAESAVGYHDVGEGIFAVAEISRTDRAEMQGSVAASGGKLIGITHAADAPEDEDSLRGWLADWLVRLENGTVPLIAPLAPAPSPNRFLLAGTAMLAAVLVLLFGLGAWHARQRKDLEQRNAQLTAAGRELEAANRRLAELKKEWAAVEKAEAQQAQIMSRRSALESLLRELAATRSEDVVLRGIQAEGPSSLVVSGLSMEAEAVDEMSMVLTQRLRAAGWTAQPKHKTGRRNLPSGGPWEFSLILTHEEAARAQAMQLSQRGDY